MLILRNKPFTRFANKESITDAALCKAVSNAERGLVDADLGGSVIKQRIARPGEGKSGGFRTVILFKAGLLAVFVHGFAKNDVANISAAELTAFRMLATEMLSYDATAIATAIADGVLTEVVDDEEAASKRCHGLDT